MTGPIAEPDGTVAPRSQLVTYLGTAPGVGKTYAMLTEGRRRAAAGERVVLGWVERHGRAETRAQAADLELVPPRQIAYRGASFDELDLEGILRSAPDVVLVDELAHTHPDGVRRRWQDVDDLLVAGCAVITTVNVANLVSLREYAATVTGAGTVECVPDEIVRSGTVVLVDLEPEALRRRILSGRVYGAESVGGALANYFQPTNLAALGMLGRAWMDGTVDEVGPALVTARAAEVQARVVVIAGVSGSAVGEQVIRRATTVAADLDAALHVVHVRVVDGLSHTPREALERDRRQAAEVGGAYLEVTAQTPADGIAAAARHAGASTVVVGRPRSRLRRVGRGPVARRLDHLLPDVSVIAVDPAS